MTYSEDELISILNVYAARLGRSPTTTDLMAFGGPQRKSFYRCFKGKGWKEIIELAGLPPIERKLPYSKSTTKDVPTRDDVLSAFKLFITDHNYMPLVYDYPDLYRLARRMFKSDREIVEACGFNYDTIMNNTKRERTKRRGLPIESDICEAVRRSMPGKKYSCEFIRDYIQGKYSK